MFRCADGRDGIARRLLGGLDRGSEASCCAGRVEFSLRFLGICLEPVGVVLRVIGPVLRVETAGVRSGCAGGMRLVPLRVAIMVSSGSFVAAVCLPIRQRRLAGLGSAVCLSSVGARRAPRQDFAGPTRPGS